VAVASKVLKNKRSKATLDGEEDDLEEDLDEEGDVEEADEHEEYDEPISSKKGKQHTTRKARGGYSTMKAKEEEMAQAKRKAAKAKGNTAVIMRLDDTDEAVRETFRRVKEAYDHFAGDDGEYSNDQESGQKRKRKGKKNKQMCGTAHAQLPVKLSAHARLATHDVSHNFVCHFYRAFISIYHCDCAFIPLLIHLKLT
jgi:hypothetical protein